MWLEETVASLTSLMRRRRLLLCPSLTGAAEPEGGQRRLLDRPADRGFYLPSCDTNRSRLDVRRLCLSPGGGARSRYPLETIGDKIRSLRSKKDDDEQSEAVWSAGGVSSCPVVCPVVRAVLPAAGAARE